MIIILGAGRIGQMLARELIEESKEVVIIEKDASVAQDVSRQLDCMIINDSGNSLEVLRQAGAENADFFIALTESDEINMIACALVASSFSKPVTVARVRNIDYSKTWTGSNRFLNIGHIVNPEIEVAKAVARTVEFGAISSVVQFETSNIQMRNFLVKSEYSITDKPVNALKKIFPVDFTIAAIIRGDNTIIPTGRTIVRAQDHLWILAGTDEFPLIFHSLNIREQKLKNIAIAGGGNIGAYIAQFLLSGTPFGEENRPPTKKLPKKKRSYNVHLIDRDLKRCEELADLFPKASVTNADIADDFLIEEGFFDNFDLMITATGNEELNIITAAHSRKSGIRKSLALVKKRRNSAIARELGVDVAVSVTETLISSLQKIIRRGAARSIYNLNNSDFEIIEFSIFGKAGFASKAIKDLNLPENSLILMITRNGYHLIPSGDLVLEPEDFLLMITDKKGIRKLT